MRVEPHSLDSFVHVIKRGARGLPIVRDTADKRRFVRLLYYANDQYRNTFWEANTFGLGEFGRPAGWPTQEPLVKILAWSLMQNHFHIVLRELIEGGVGKFMQQLCGSMSMHFNKKYDESGSIFQSSYKCRTANTRGDEYLRLLAVYVMVKNAIKNFDAAYARAGEYQFCSLGDYSQVRSSLIVSKDIFGEIFDSPDKFKSFAKESLLCKLDKLNEIDTAKQ